MTLKNIGGVEANSVSVLWVSVNHTRKVSDKLYFFGGVGALTHFLLSTA